MSARSFVVREPRNFRVLIGGVFAIVSLLSGCGCAFLWQRNLSIKPFPDDLTVAELLERGLGENNHVRLTDAVLGGPADAVQAFGDTPVIMIEPGSGSIDGQAGLVMRATESQQSLAAEMFESDGTLRGRVHRDDELRSLVQTLRWLDAEVSEHPLWKDVSIEGYPLVFDPDEDPLVTAGQTKANVQWILIGLLSSGILGLLMAGSGGPSIWPWFLAPLPALMHLPGFFLRYGRGNSLTRGLYLIAGAGMLGGAYLLTMHESKILQPEFNVMLTPAVFLLVAFGGAAVLGAGLNFIRGGSRDSATDLQSHMSAMVSVPGSKVSNEIRRAGSASGDLPASGFHQDLTIRRYQDPQIGIADDPVVPPSMETITCEFEGMDFESPLVIDVGSDEEAEKETIQIGCRNMVMIVTHTAGDSTSGQAHARLFGILDNGQVVTTLSPGSPAVNKVRTSSSGVVWIASKQAPAELLSQHIEKMVSVAQAAGTNITELQSGEWRDVYAYAHRVMIDIGHQHGDNGYKVYPSSHGRFRFPFQPVELLGEMSHA